MSKLYFKVDQKQYNTLSGLRYRIADKGYQREHSAPDAEIEQTHKTICSLFDEADALGIPFWVQNVVIASVQDKAGTWRNYLEEYTFQVLESHGIDCSEVTTR